MMHSSFFFGYFLLITTLEAHAFLFGLFSFVHCLQVYSIVRGLITVKYLVLPQALSFIPASVLDKVQANIYIAQYGMSREP
jgi:hypothetical protein